MDKDQFAKIVKLFSKTNYDNEGTHSYSAGYLESVVIAMYAELPEDSKKYYADLFLNNLAGKK